MGDAFLNDTVQRANLDGTDVETLVDIGSDGLTGIALDVDGGKMYWSDNVPDIIQRANLDGTDVETTVPNAGNANAIALDVAEGKVYWATFFVSSGDIRRANLDGSDVETVLTNLSLIRGIAIDSSAAKIYWKQDDSIQRANLDGTDIETLVTISGFLGGIALDVAGGKMYWTDNSGIQRANLDGTDVEMLVTGSGFRGIAILPAPTCSSSVTTIPSLMAEVDVLTTSVQTINTLNNTLANVETALDNDNNTTARSRMENFISKVVNRSNYKESNNNRIPLDEANSLICGGANVLIGISLP